MRVKSSLCPNEGRGNSGHHFSTKSACAYMSQQCRLACGGSFFVYDCRECNLNENSFFIVIYYSIINHLSKYVRNMD